MKNFLNNLLNVDKEGNIPSVYSSLTLLGCALLLTVITYVNKLDNLRYQRHWRVLSMIFFYLAFDKLFQFHEEFILPLRALFKASGFLFFTWVLLGFY